LQQKDEIFKNADICSTYFESYKRLERSKPNDEGITDESTYVMLISGS